MNILNLLPAMYMAFMLNVSIHEVSPVVIDSNSRIVFAPESKMYLRGNTSVNSYSCACPLNSDRILLVFENESNKISFRNISLNISTSNINCNKELYNRNIKKTLDAERYPNIRIDLLQAWKADGSIRVNDSEWFEVVSKTNLTIKDVSRVEEINASAKHLGGNKYRIKGSKFLNMQNFNIEAPEFFFGIIKVKEEIIIDFDLVFEITN